MRGIVLVLATLGFLPLCLRFPAVGAICWAWFSIMSPHRQIFGFAAGQPFNSVIAAATLLGWICSRERKRWTPDLMPWLLLLFTVWMTFNSFFAPFPDWSWPYWDRTMRDLVFVFLIFFLATTKARIHGFILALVVSLGYYGLKGGVFTIMTGGHAIVLGPPDTILSDNNQLAAAVVMVLPLVNYLRLHTGNRLLRIGLTAAIWLQVLMVFGSHSRGGFLALLATAAVFWVRSRRKVTYGIAGVILFGAALYVMPASFMARMDTITHAEQDSSFMGRVEAWHVATYVAIDRFPFGAGFYAPQLPQIFDSYYPGAIIHAAHSIFFQVLGEHGFIGLAIYLMILVLALRNAGIVMRQTRDRPELLWAYDLANMIRTGLIGFYVGGAALSMAYFDGFLLLIALLSTLRELTAPKTLPVLAAAQPEIPRLARSRALEPAQFGRPSLPQT